MPILTAEERVGSILHAGPEHSGFRLERVLSRGGSGTVFEATSLSDGSPAAIKVIDHAQIASETAALRFAREVHATKLVEHPNVVRLFGTARTSDGAPCLILELLRGKTLKMELAERGSVPPQLALEWLLPIMGVLALLHDAGVVHRDIKPSNIFLDGSAEGAVPKLLDFGIAKDTEATHLTRSGAVAGTPEYMAPEQASDGAIGPWTDVWAMGVVLYQALSGNLPFVGATSASVLVKVVHERPAPLLERAPKAGSRLSAAIDRALERSPSARYRDMRAFARAVALAAQAQGIELPKSPDQRGLPDFRQWLEQERDERTETRDVPGVEPASLFGAVSLRARAIFAALAGVALVALLISSPWARSREPSEGSSSERMVPRQPVFVPTTPSSENPPVLVATPELDPAPRSSSVVPIESPPPTAPSAKLPRRSAVSRKKPPPPVPSAPPPSASSGESSATRRVFPGGVVDTRW